MCRGLLDLLINWCLETSGDYNPDIQLGGDLVRLGIGWIEKEKFKSLFPSETEFVQEKVFLTHL
jgi:hypothetical protein